MERIFEYAIIRLIPYAHRGEQLNVGVIVFNKTGIDIHLKTLPAVLRIFGLTQTSLDWLHGYLKRADDPSMTVTDRWKQLSKGAGYSLSELGWFSTLEDSEYSTRVEEIVSDYVDRPITSQSSKKRTNLLKELKSAFQFHEILGKNTSDLNNHKVVSNIPVGPAGKLHIDFLLRNSFYHATETIDFRRSEDAGTSELKDAALASVTFRYAREQLGANSTKCYLVYAAPPLIEKAVQPALSLLETSVDRAFNMESKADKKAYIDCMLEASGHTPLV